MNASTVVQLVKGGEAYLEAHHIAAKAVIKDLYDVLGVTKHRWRRNIPADAEVFPGAANVAFVQSEKRVYHAAPIRRSLLYLPHEAVHCVWPEVPEDAADEWEVGLIPYELAWLERLCTTPTQRRCLGVWQQYADEGVPGHPDDVAEAWGRARDAVDEYNLPDPWEGR